MGQNFTDFAVGLTFVKICIIHKLGIIVFSFCTVQQHLRKLYPGIFIFGAICKNLVPGEFPLYGNVGLW